MKIIICVIIAFFSYSVIAASAYDIDKMTTYSVILGRAVACGVDIRDASSRVGLWMDKVFPPGSSDQTTLLPIFMAGIEYHAKQQASGNSPDSCSSVIKSFNSTIWPEKISTLTPVIKDIPLLKDNEDKLCSDKKSCDYFSEAPVRSFDGKILSRHFQDKFNIDHIAVTINNYCSYDMGACESLVGLVNNKSKSMVITEAYYGGNKSWIEKKYINIINDKFITIDYEHGGSAHYSRGVQVYDIENLEYIGAFDNIKDNSLVRVESVYSDLTAKAGNPMWDIYYNYDNKKVIFNEDKTCKKDKSYFQKNIKKFFLDVKRGYSPSDRVEALFEYLAFYKWCGHDKEYYQMLSLANSKLILDAGKIQILYKALSELKKLDHSDVDNAYNHYNRDVIKKIRP